MSRARRGIDCTCDECRPGLVWDMELQIYVGCALAIAIVAAIEAIRALAAVLGIGA